MSRIVMDAMMALLVTRIVAIGPVELCPGSRAVGSFVFKGEDAACGGAGVCDWLVVAVGLWLMKRR